jgi:hypothetical protein
VVLSCKNSLIIENQYKYWNKYFKKEYDEYYNIFLEERNKGEFLSDYSLCMQLLGKIEESNV